MYLHVCRHVCIQHTCTYAALMSQDTYRYSQIHADTAMCISHIHCAYVICIQMYPVHMCVHMFAVCASNTCTYINPYVCCMCFTYMHICTGRITDGRESAVRIPRSARLRIPAIFRSEWNAILAGSAAAPR
jgi:hypothetical protein